MLLLKRGFSEIQKAGSDHGDKRVKTLDKIKFAVDFVCCDPHSYFTKWQFGTFQLQGDDILYFYCQPFKRYI